MMHTQLTRNCRSMKLFENRKKTRKEIIVHELKSKDNAIEKIETSLKA